MTLKMMICKQIARLFRRFHINSRLNSWNHSTVGVWDSRLFQDKPVASFAVVDAFMSDIAAFQSKRRVRLASSSTVHQPTLSERQVANPVDVAIKLCRILEQHHMPYAIGGDLAYVFHIPRRTVVNVDLYIGIDFRTASSEDLPLLSSPTYKRHGLLDQLNALLLNCPVAPRKPVVCSSAWMERTMHLLPILDELQVVAGNEQLPHMIASILQQDRLWRCQWMECQ